MSKPTNVSLSCCPAQIYRSKNCLSAPSSPDYRFSLTGFLYSLLKGMLEHQLPAAAKHLLHSPSIPIVCVFICQSNDKIVFRSSLIGAFTLRRAKICSEPHNSGRSWPKPQAQQTLRTIDYFLPTPHCPLWQNLLWTQPSQFPRWLTCEHRAASICL